MAGKINKNEIMTVIFAGFGLIFLVTGVLVFITARANFEKLKESGIKTDGIVSDILYSEDDTRVFITFRTNDGTEITTELNYYNSKMYIGKQIELYYDPLNPYRVARTQDNFHSIFLLLFGGIGLIFFIIGVAVFRKSYVLKKRRDRLISSGRAVMAEIIEINQNTGIELNGESPYRINAKYSEKDKDYFFNSHDIWFKPSCFPGKKVRVYVDRNDYSNYYVDEGSLDKN